MIGICGAGAIGKLWAYRLGAGNCAFISTRRKAADSQTDQPQNIQFEITDTHGSANDRAQRTIPLYYLNTSNDVAANFKAVLICTKSYDALDAAVDLDTSLPSSIPFVLFQNGLGSQQRIITKLTSRQIFAASTTSGANINNKGQLVLAGDGETLIGALNKHANDISGRNITQVLTGSTDNETDSVNGHRIDYTTNIEPLLWKKLLINCGINAITALENVPNGNISDTRTFSELWPDLINELTYLAPKADISSTSKEIEALILDVAEKTGKNISSMLQDVRASKQTEIDDINGYACWALQQQNCSASANEELTRRVHALRN